MTKTVNYTPEQVEMLRAAEPVSYADAVAFATEWGKSVRSVISKVKSEDLEYIPKPKPTKRETPETKAEIVATIAEALDVNKAALRGLDKATVGALTALRELV